MNGFNLSGWALNHRSLVSYLMIVAIIAGILSYVRLDRGEDPAFIIKTMVVQAAWPGATVASIALGSSRTSLSTFGATSTSAAAASSLSNG